MTFTTKSLLCLALLFGIFIGDASADAKKLPPPSSRGKITKVDQSTMIVTAQLTPEGNPVSFTFNDQSTVEVNNKTATVKQIKPGLFIRSIRLDSSSPPVVEDLDLTSAAD